MRRLVILLALLLAACGSRAGDDLAGAARPGGVVASTPPGAPDTPSPSLEAPPAPAGVEARPLGTLRGDWAFVSRTVNDGAGGWGTSEIWAVPLDGGAPRLALRYPRSWSDPLFAGWQLSPEGRRFAFATELEGVQRLLVADLERGTVRRAHDDGGPLHDGEATWSPDGRRLAFVRYAREPRQAGAYAGLWLVDLDGGAPRRLLESNDQPTRLYPWTPDGRIALAHGVGYLLLDPDTGHSAAIERIVTPADWRRGSPAWVAFRADGIGEERHIVVGEADLSSERVIVREREPVFLSRPRWNPLRDEILYVRAEPTGGPTSLVEIRTLVLGAEPLTFPVAGRPLIVEWAPSGDAVLYLHEEHAPTDRGFSSELVSLRLATRSGEDREIFRPEGGSFPSAIGAIGARRYP